MTFRSPCQCLRPLSASMASWEALVLFLVAYIALQQVALAGTYTDHWEIIDRTINPDCAQPYKAALVNGTLPGPTINVYVGDRIIVTVTNKQKLEVTIHWHGIRQKGTQWADGVFGVTQCSIAPGTSYTYNFTVDMAGTHWWHAHTAMLRHLVLGQLNVHERNPKERPVPIKRNRNFMLTDWYHSDPMALEASVLGVPFQGFPTPDSLLVNGHTACKGKQHVTYVRPGKWYRLRVVNGALYAQFNFVVQNHTLWTYEAEGGLLKRAAYSSYDIISGQSYSFLIHANQKPGSYWVMARPRYDVEGLDLFPGTAQLTYVGTTSPASGGVKLANQGPQVANNPSWTWFQINSLKGAEPVPDWVKRDPDVLVQLQLNMHLLPDQSVRYSMNNVTNVFPATPLLYQVYTGKKEFSNMPLLPPRGLAQAVKMKAPVIATSVLTVPYNATVQLVMQNFIPPGLNHPIHLHGHNFYEVARGPGYFDAAKWRSYKYNTEDPVYRNTMYLLENTWVAVRFRTDNPGMWIMHCHLEPHVDTGMAAFFQVIPPDYSLPNPPKDYPKCPSTSSRKRHGKY